MVIFMRIKLVLKPGQAGTKKMVAKYGDRLICVRYRYDDINKKRYKTVELIEDETDWVKIPAADAIVVVEIIWGEIDLARHVKRAGGKWNPDHKGLELPYSQVVSLGLEDRIIHQQNP